eukprot:gnl/TRDRNA2_/TRDRNA2_172450_c0_seq5.p1 gnl/TRDRNA2_/TRDRNA2_172450_c0~~gnl/TRDRNA2_/TRDRNA2_172450_c0_seq5.p1  ORF type:complete len:205 (+),score=20.56 gnl/TRDRNA2_/TRDRNA2_172450_c0_seq5:157-771(+)
MVRSCVAVAVAELAVRMRFEQYMHELGSTSCSCLHERRALDGVPCRPCIRLSLCAQQRARHSDKVCPLLQAAASFCRISQRQPVPRATKWRGALPCLSFAFGEQRAASSSSTLSKLPSVLSRQSCAIGSSALRAWNSSAFVSSRLAAAAAETASGSVSGNMAEEAHISATPPSMPRMRPEALSSQLQGSERPLDTRAGYSLGRL